MHRSSRNSRSGWMALGLNLLVVSVLCCGHQPATAQDALGRRASWESPSFAEVREQVLAWLDQAMLEPALREKAVALWPEQPAVEEEVALLERLAETFSLCLPDAQPLVAQCRAPRPLTVQTKFPIVDDEQQQPLVRANLQLYLARWLVQQQLYDEALEQFGHLQPDQVVAPATLLFHQGVAHHRLLQKEQCLPKLAKLMENENSIPRRYREVSRLMAADLEPLKPDTLDEISRIMDNVQRRLDLGRAGKRVRQEEDDVIAKLDKLIEQMEQQQQQQQQQGGAAGGNNAPSNPLEDSVPAGGTGPGNVAQKSIGRSSGWGNLPPKEREEAMQEITKNLPAHYREVIEEYFRKLAQTSQEAAR